MEWKADGLLLRAADYGENDKMVTLLTAVHGKIGAAMKGVRKAGAKLRFASQPFCFAEYVFAERSGRYTVTQASLYDGFYGLRTDVSKYYAASAVVEVSDAFSQAELESGALLVAAVQALERIEGGDPDSALVRFLLAALRFAGYPVTADRCSVCGGEIAGQRYFDMASGSFTCAACAAGVRASESTYEVLRAHIRGEGIDACPSDGYIRALRLLRAYAVYHADSSFPALSEYLRL